MVYSSLIVHRTVRHAEPANDHYGNTTGCYGNPSACACSVYQAPSRPPLEGLGMRLGLVLQLAQWYYSSGVPSLYLLVFYHCIHNKVDGDLEHLPPPLHVHLCITIYSCQTDPVYQQTASSPRGVPLILLATTSSGWICCKWTCEWCMYVVCAYVE